MDLGLDYRTGIELWNLALIIELGLNYLDYINGTELWILALIIEMGLNYGSWP